MNVTVKALFALATATLIACGGTEMEDAVPAGDSRDSTIQIGDGSGCG